MNSLHVHDKIGLALLVVGFFALAIAIATVDVSCLTPAADAPRLATDATPRSAKPDGIPEHCLVYGKYCVSEALHSR